MLGAPAGFAIATVVDMDSPEDRPFDRRLRRARRDRAAACDDGADYLVRRAADELIDRLGQVKRDFQGVLDLGCGRGHLTRLLRERGLNVTPADAGAAFAAAADGVQCDEDRLPFAPGSFDLVVSVGVWTASATFGHSPSRGGP